MEDRLILVHYYIKKRSLIDDVKCERRIRGTCSAIRSNPIKIGIRNINYPKITSNQGRLVFYITFLEHNKDRYLLKIKNRIILKTLERDRHVRTTKYRHIPLTQFTRN